MPLSLRRTAPALATCLILLPTLAASYTVAPPKRPGGVKVVVRLSGTLPPAAKPLEVTVDRDACGVELPDESLLVDPSSRGLSNAVFRLEGIARGKAPEKEIRISNRRCRFEPRIAVATAGETVVFLNDDEILHSMHPYLNRKNFFNVPLGPKQSTPRGRPIPETGLMDLKCDIHSFMRGYVFVHDSPYSAVTGADGVATLGDVPPGTWKWVAWHETLGERHGTTTVSSGEPVEVDVDFGTADKP